MLASPLYPSSWEPPKYPEPRVSQGLYYWRRKFVGLLEVLCGAVGVISVHDASTLEQKLMVFHPKDVKINQSLLLLGNKNSDTGGWRERLWAL